MSTDLVEPLAPGLAALLDAARAIPAPPADLQRRLLARLEVSLGLPGGPGTTGGGGPTPAPAGPGPGPAPASPASGGTGAAAHLLPQVLAHPWMLGAALLAVGLGAGALWYGVRARSPRTMPAPAAPAVAAPVAVAPAAAAPEVPPVAASPAVPSAGGGAAVAAPPPAPSVAARGRESNRQEPRSGTARTGSPVGSTAASGGSPLASAPHHDHAATGRGAAAEAARDTVRSAATPATAPPELARPRQPGQPDRPDLPDLDDEMAPIEAARTALGRGDAAGALRQLAVHERRFPRGRLVEEREALRIRALATTGRDRELRTRAAAFLARFPHSLFRPMVEQALGVGTR